MDFYPQEEQDYRNDGIGGKILGTILVILFFPAFLVGFLFYLVTFRLLRLKPTLSVPPALITSGLLLVFGKKPISGIKNIAYGFSNNKFAIIGGYLYLSLIIGLIIGTIIILIRAFNLKRHPELRHVRGWAYKFNYRPTLLQALRKKKNIQSLKSGNEFDYEKAPIGILIEPVKNADLEDTVDDKHSNAASIIYRYYTEAKEHTLITGKTGSGKTQTMLALIQNDILAGNPVCVIDFKKSPDFVYFLSKWAQEHNRKFYHFIGGKLNDYNNPYVEHQATYDPLSTGSATSKADMILNLRTWDASSEVFKKRTQDVLQSLFFLLERTPRSAVPGIDWDSGGLAQFVSALDLNNFKSMIEYMAKENEAGKLSPGDQRRFFTLLELHKELATPRQSDLKAQIIELLSIARTLIVSNYGDWLAKGASPLHIDLMDVAISEEAPIVLFSFNQQEEPEFAKYIGSIVMSDISRVSALKNAMGNRNNFGIYIDEFQTLDPVTVKDNLEKARSSGMYITLSLQSIDQIISSSQSNGEAMAGAIIDTTANFIFHDGSGYDTAEKMSKIVGDYKRYEYKSTSSVSNKIFQFNLFNRKSMISKDIAEDWIIPQSQFQSLSSPNKSNNYAATAYVINKAPDDPRFTRRGGALARKVQVVVPVENAEGVPADFLSEFSKSTIDKMDFDRQQSQFIAEIANDMSEENVTDGEWIIEDIDPEPEVIKYETPPTPVKQSQGMPKLPNLDPITKPAPQPKVEEKPKAEPKPKSQPSPLDEFAALRAGAKKPNKQSKPEPKEDKPVTMPDLSDL